MIDASKTKFKWDKGMENKERCLFGQGSQGRPLCGGNIQIKDLSEQREVKTSRIHGWCIPGGCGIVGAEYQE